MVLLTQPSFHQARRYGVKTSMKLFVAQKICPRLIQRASRPERYAEIPSMIMRTIADIIPNIRCESMNMVPVIAFQFDATQNSKN